MSFHSSFLNPGPTVRQIDPNEAAELVKAGKAVLVDVRQPDEWADTGVAEPAVLVPLRELGGPAGRDLVEKNRGKEFIFYCLSGSRSAAAARAFVQMGFKASNAGGIGDWAGAGLPMREV